MEQMKLIELSEKVNNNKNELSDVNKKIREFEENDIVKEYLSLIGRRNEIIQNLVSLEEELAKEEMLNCNHIFLQTSDNPDFCCIKCGLNNKNYPHIFASTIKKGFLLNTYSSNLAYAKILYKNIKKKNSSFNDRTISVMIEKEMNQMVKKKLKNL